LLACVYPFAFALLDTIIAHVRWFDTDGVKHDMARATIKEFVPIPPPEEYDYRPIVAALGILLGLTVVALGIWAAHGVHKKYKEAMCAATYLPR
jgi:hypothetical protein